MNLIFITFAIFITLEYCYCIYVPGVSPNEYKMNDLVDVKAVKIASRNTQLPYDYYALKFCSPKTKVIYNTENLGEILRGDRVVNTPYEIRMAQPKKCAVLCKVELNAKETTKFYDFIKSDYSVHLTADNLPSATKFMANEKIKYDYGHKIGFMKGKDVYLNNHVIFKMKYHSTDNLSYRVVGFEIFPMSINSEKMKVDDSECIISEDSGADKGQLLKRDTPTTVYFTYEVQWFPSDVKWASRWDVYLQTTDGQVHLFSILNSILIIFLLSGLLAMIMVRALRRDIAKYNRDEDAEDILEESGWKLIHGDVFRPPKNARLFVAILGSGVQLFCMVFIVIFFAMLGMLSPANRGAVMSAFIFTYVFMGVFAGYFSGRMYKTIRGQLWKSTAVLTGVLFPGVILSFGFFLNFFLWGSGSSAAVPFGTIFALLSLWCLVSLPLVFIGFYFGFRKRPYEQPVRTNQIPRAIPDQKFRQNIIVSSLLAGSLPFGAMSVELFFVMSAMWNKQIYYLFGFLFIVFVIYTICCAQISVVLTYFQLCNEDYQWWWRSLVVSGGPAIYVFGYTIYYFLTQLTIDGLVPTVIYFGYSLIMSVTLWILSGTIGFFAAFHFMRKIYGAIKVD